MHRKSTVHKKVSALVVAVAALFAVALATPLGATARDFVTSPEIKDGGVYSPDIHDQGVRSVDIREGGVHQNDLADRLQNKLNKVGRPGEDGVANPSAAGAGYAGLGAHDEWPADDQIHETVEKCDDGEYVTGGGYSTWGGAGLTPTKDLGGNADVQVTVSAPYIESDGAYVPISGEDSRFLADRWVVRGYNHGDSPVDVRAWVLCAPLPQAD